MMMEGRPGLGPRGVPTWTSFNRFICGYIETSTPPHGQPDTTENVTFPQSVADDEI